MAFTLPALPLRLTDANGNILAGAKMYVFEAGTTTPTDCYTSSALSVAHPNPLVADSGGMFEEAFFSAGTYKIRFTTAGEATIWEVDNYNVPETGSTISFPSEVKTANFTLTSADRAKVFLCDASGAPGSNIVVTADSETLGNDFPFWVVNFGASGTITVQGTGSQTINGQLSLVLNLQYASAGFVSSGAAGWTKFSAAGSFPATDIGDSTSVGRAILTASTAQAQADLIPSPVISGDARGLKFGNNATNPNYQVDVTATELVVKNSSGLPRVLSSVSVTADISTSGAGGLDTGTEANSTWYYVWVIYNGTTVSGLLSVSATAPTLPSGYTFSALVGAIYNESGGNFRLTRGFGKRVFHADVEALNAAGVTSWTSLSIATSVPAIAVHAYGRSSIETNNLVGIRVASDSSGVIGVREAVANAGATTVVDSQYGGSNFDLPLVTAQTIWRKHNATTAGQIIINGFDMP
jgi:hypothetical protein